MQASDPRLSIEERYKNRSDYASKVQAAANALVAQGYLLQIDVPRLVKRSMDTWDWLMKPARKR